MSKNVVEQGRPQTTMWRMCLHAGYLSYKHTLRICNTYCFCNGCESDASHCCVLVHYLSC